MPPDEQNKQPIPLDTRQDLFEDLLPSKESDELILGIEGDSRGLSMPFTSLPQLSSVVFNKEPAKAKASSGNGETAPPDVYIDAKDRERAIKTPYTTQNLIDKIQQMPDNMLPKYLRDKADVIVNDFQLNTREKVALFFGQISAESLRGFAEYVYFDKKSFSAIKSKYSNYETGDEENFIFSESALKGGTKYGIKIPPWEKGGMYDKYYGGSIIPRDDLGNKYGEISTAVDGPKNIKEDEVPASYQVNPGHYEGSTEGYAYRGHGALQSAAVGKSQYQKLTDKLKKYGLDLVKEPWKATEREYAALVALAWWDDHRGIKETNEITRESVKRITQGVSNSTTTAEQRYYNTINYFNFLLGGTTTNPNTSSPVPSGPVPWMNIAKGEVGVKELPGGTSNPNIIKYHSATGAWTSAAAAANKVPDDADAVPWCASFVEWCIESAGVKPRGSAGAAAWLTWGKPSQPRYGAVAVVKTYINDKWQNHVGFLHAWTDTHVHLLGGNQSNMVKISAFARNAPKQVLLGIRWTDDPRYP